MATINPVITDASAKVETEDKSVSLPIQVTSQVIRIAWLNLGAADVGAAVKGLAHMVDKHIFVPQVGTIGSLSFEGSDDDGANWKPVNLSDGVTPAVITASGFYQIMEAPLMMRVSSVGAAGARAYLVGRIPTL